MGNLIVDADILIDHMRGLQAARKFIEEQHRIIVLSVITVAELYLGFKGDREKQDMIALCDFFPKLEITEIIAINAGLYRNRYSRSHGTGLADCLLAATAKSSGATLASLNKKHYPMLDKVLIPYKKS